MKNFVLYFMFLSTFECSEGSLISLTATPLIQTFTSHQGYNGITVYPNDYKQDWYIKTNWINHTIRIHYADCHIENAKGICLFDYLYIYDGPNSTSPRLLKTCCGATKSASLVSSAGEMYIYFDTDSSIGDIGFEIEYWSNGITTTTTTTTVATTTTTSTATTPTLTTTAELESTSTSNPSTDGSTDFSTTDIETTSSVVFTSTAYIDTTTTDETSSYISTSSSDVYTSSSDAPTPTTDITTTISDVPTSTTGVITTNSEVTTYTTDITTTNSEITTYTTEITTTNSEVTTYTTDITTTNSEAPTSTIEITTTNSEVTTYTTDISTTNSEAPTSTIDITTTNSEVTTYTTDVITTNSEAPSSTIVLTTTNSEVTTSNTDIASETTSSISDTSYGVSYTGTSITAMHSTVGSNITADASILEQENKLLHVAIACAISGFLILIIIIIVLCICFVCLKKKSTNRSIKQLFLKCGCYNQQPNAIISESNSRLIVEDKANAHQNILQIGSPPPAYTTLVREEKELVPSVKREEKGLVPSVKPMSANLHHNYLNELEAEQTELDRKENASKRRLNKREKNKNKHVRNDEAGNTQNQLVKEHKDGFNATNENVKNKPTILKTNNGDTQMDRSPLDNISFKEKSEVLIEATSIEILQENFTHTSRNDRQNATDALNNENATSVEIIQENSTLTSRNNRQNAQNNGSIIHTSDFKQLEKSLNTNKETIMPVLTATNGAQYEQTFVLDSENESDQNGKCKKNSFLSENEQVSNKNITDVSVSENAQMDLNAEIICTVATQGNNDDANDIDIFQKLTQVESSLITVKEPSLFTVSNRSRNNFVNRKENVTSSAPAPYKNNFKQQSNRPRTTSNKKRNLQDHVKPFVDKMEELKAIYHSHSNHGQNDKNLSRMQNQLYSDFIRPKTIQVNPWLVQPAVDIPIDPTEKRLTKATLLRRMRTMGVQGIENDEIPQLIPKSHAFNIMRSGTTLCDEVIANSRKRSLPP